MITELSYSPSKPARFASPLLLVAAAALFSFGPGASRAVADGAPEWMHAAARDTMPPAEKDAVAVILLDEIVTTVKDNGDVEVLHRRVYKILRPEARRDFGDLEVAFDKDTRITSFKAWTIPASGKDFELKEKDATERGSFSEFLYDGLRVKRLQFPAVVPGNFVGYEYSQQARPYLLSDVWDFQETVPIRRSRYVLQLPPGWEMSTRWSNHPELKETSTGGNSFSWELENIPAIVVEPDMPPFEAIAGRMAVRYFPRDPALRAKSSGTWNDIALWYAGLTASSRASTPEIKQKVAELTANAPTTLDKIKALVSFMQRDIRYVAVEIGIGGFQPHPAGDVFHFRYGDCKDKATLLGAMLKDIGVDSYYVVAQTERGILNPEFPTAYPFNHMIIAIRLPDDVPTAGLWAIVDHPKYGRLLIFDPTNTYTPLGYIPSHEQSNYGLLVTPTGGELIPLPLLAPATNRLMRIGEFTLSPTGQLSGDVKEIRWGGPASHRRQWLLETSPANRIRVIEDFLGQHLSNFRITSVTVENLEKYDDNLILHYKFVAENYAMSTGDLLMVRPRVLGFNAWVVDPGKPRKYPFEFPEALIESDDYTISLPAGFIADDLPDPAEVKSDCGSYKSKIEVTGNTIHYQRLYQITSVYVPMDQLPDLRTFFGRISADERASAVLRRSP
jgi:transglutaminase-like putative cysteine protease